MRIDYSEPKKSCTSSPTLSSQNHSRKESSGAGLITLFITGLLCLGIGFGSGWTISQRSTKQGFMAATEQQSLENSPQQAKASQPSSNQPTTPLPTEQPQPDGTTTQPAIAAKMTEPQLTFYKTLASGQKNNALGSGINTNGKPAKLPLQAALPANITKPAPPSTDGIDQQAATPAATTKPVPAQSSNGFTVQVSSYSLKSEAEFQRAKLTSKGYNVNIIKSNLGDKGIWYRVCVGKQLDPDSARELAKKLGRGAISVPDKN